MISRNLLAEGFDLKTSHYYTLDRGEIVTPEWTEREIVKRLPKFMSLYLRQMAAASVVRNGFWNRTTVGHMVRQAEEKYWELV